MSYEKNIWIDHIVDPETGEVIQQGTRFTEARANKMEQGIYDNDVRSTENKAKLDNSFFADLEAYYGNTKLIDDFQDSSLWTVGGATQSTDVTNLKLGKQSLKLLEPDNVASSMVSSKNGLSLDLTILGNGKLSSDDDYITVVVYVSDAAKVNTIEVAFSQDTPYSNTNRKYKPFAVTTGWNFLKAKKSEFLSSGTGKWDGIQSVRAAWASTDNAQNAYVSFQLIQLVKKDPLADYPNPFQKVGVREFSINSGEWFVGREFGRVVTKCLESTSSGQSLSRDNLFYNDFISYKQVRPAGTPTSNVAYMHSFEDESKNLNILAYITGGKLRILERIPSGQYLEGSKTISISNNTKIESKIIRKNGFLRCIVYIDGEYFDEVSAEFGSGVPLSIGHYTTTAESPRREYISAESITEISHAHHADISEIAKGLIEQPFAKIFSNVNQSFSNGANASVAFNTVREDNRKHFDPNNPTVLTIRENGKYIISFNGIWGINNSGYRRAAITVNGTIYAYDVKNASSISTSHNFSVVLNLKVGDTVSVSLLQNSGVALDLLYSNAYSPELSILKIG